MVIQMSDHITVLKEEAISYLNVHPNGIYVDATLGGGGHSEGILTRLKDGHLYAFDQDTEAIKRATSRLEQFANITIIQDNFVNLKARLEEYAIDGIDGILFDLGVSSFQFDTPERGFSYQFDHRLDMRMNQNESLSAYQIINTYSEPDLAKIIFQYGEEPFARIIARQIVRKRLEKPIETTLELVDVIKQSLPEKVLKKKGHPAKQTFQALRIAVNDELGVLRMALKDAVSLLSPGGRIVTISFHSLEDRICKQLFRELSSDLTPKDVMILPSERPILSLITKHVITPSEGEILANNRAKSAKLRAAEKTR